METRKKYLQLKITYSIFTVVFYVFLQRNTSTVNLGNHQLIREHVVFLFTFDTCDVVRSWSNFLLPSIVLDNLFDFYCSFFRQYYRKKFENADEMQKKNFILQGRQNKSGFDYPVKKKRMKDLSLIKKILS